MATFDYAEMQAVANELITEFGQSGTVKRETPPDLVYGGEPTVTSYPATLVPMAYEARFVDGTVIKTGDMQIYIASVGLPIVPGPGDIVSANGADYLIINADPNKYDGVTNVVHIVQGRIAA